MPSLTMVSSLENLQPEKTKKLDNLKKDSENPNGKHSGKKHANATNKSSPVSAKKLCILHGTLSLTLETNVR